MQVSSHVGWALCWGKKLQMYPKSKQFLPVQTLPNKAHKIHDCNRSKVGMLKIESTVCAMFQKQKFEIS